MHVFFCGIVKTQPKVSNSTEVCSVGHLPCRLVSFSVGQVLVKNEGGFNSLARVDLFQCHASRLVRLH